MEVWAQVLGMFALVGLVVGVPLSILRSLDEIKAGQRRIEARLAEVETRMVEQEHAG